MKKFSKFALLTPLLFFIACATGPTFQGAPSLPVTSQSVMTGKPCSALPVDHFPNENWGMGWSKTPPTGMTELSCGNKYLTSKYCAKKEGCKTSTYGTNTPVGKDATKVTWVVDVLQGSIAVCAQQSGSYGVGSLDCNRVSCAAVGSMPTRCILPVQVKGQGQPQGPTQVTFDATRDETVVGVIGTTEAMN